MSDFEIVGDFKVVNIDHENISGYEKYSITVDDVAALLSGKALRATFDDEYVFEIILKRGEKR